MSHKYNVPRRQRGSPRPAWGNGAVCPAMPGANAHGVPRTAVTSGNGAPSRPAGRVQPCRFDLLPPCTPITARQRTHRSDWASRAARIGPLPGDQAVTRPRCHRRTVPGVTSRSARSLPGRSLISAASTARWAPSHRAQCGAHHQPHQRGLARRHRRIAAGAWSRRRSLGTRGNSWRPARRRRSGRDERGRFAGARG